MAGTLAEVGPSLLVVRPTHPGVDASGWAREHQAALGQALLHHGALLVRDFELGSVERVGAFARTLSADLPNFHEESSPRSQLGPGVYTSTDYPSAYPIPFHNEHSYANEWPMRVYFGCVIPPARGGETPIASSRGVLRRLREETREAFRRRRVMYVRNFRPHVGVSWQTAFATEDRSAVQDYCQEAGIETEWLSDDQLRTRHVRDAIVRHPVTDEEVWFNHGFFFNIAALEPSEVREYLLASGEAALPTNTYFGDGAPIPNEWIEEIRAAYAAEAVRFTWKRGDVLLIDNMLTAHAREPFRGERRIVVVMAERLTRKALAATSPSGTRQSDHSDLT